MCNIALFKNEFKIILFAAIKKMILEWISTNWLSMEITLYKKHKFPCNESLYSSLELSSTRAEQIGYLIEAKIICTTALFTISVSLFITSIYPCTSVYANVKCRTRDNTSPYSAFWREKFHITTGILKKGRQQTSQKSRNAFFSTGAVVCFLAQTLA